MTSCLLPPKPGITKLKFILRYDDCLDIFAAHAIGGLVGNICTDFFAQSSVAAFDGIAVIPGGWLDHNRVQLGCQLADSTAGISYSFVMTTIILWIMHFISGCRICTDEESEIVCIDDSEMGEFAYDYVAVDAELGPKADWLVLPIMAVLVLPAAKAKATSPTVVAANTTEALHQNPHNCQPANLLEL
ncbi:hypothetical protein FRC01_013731 [Tulasnella sp. 417]|nr:hypothetical protein FRC01_013731 [Tulasnella sp. 417]